MDGWMDGWVMVQVSRVLCVVIRVFKGLVCCDPCFQGSCVL